MTPSPDADEEKYLLAQSIDHFLATAALMARAFDNDHTTMIVFMTILRASASHLNRDRGFSPRAISGVFPDSLRRPVSIMAISELTRFPYETTRRHVLKLVETGYCTRLGSREFIVPEDVLRGPAFGLMATENRAVVVDFVQHIHGQLEALDGLPGSGRASEDAI